MRLLHEEIEKLVLITRIPSVTAYVRAQKKSFPATGDAAAAVGLRLKSCSTQSVALLLSPPIRRLRQFCHNDVAHRLRMLTAVDGHPRQTQVTNAAGQLIAADDKTDDFFQADEGWWQTAFGTRAAAAFPSVPSPRARGRRHRKLSSPATRSSKFRCLCTTSSMAGKRWLASSRTNSR